MIPNYTNGDTRDVPNIAIIKNNGSEIDIIDKSGKIRTFIIEGKALTKKVNLNPSSEEQQTLCFSSHHIDEYGLADAMLTPCFDAKGFHGEPDEICFCGIESAHVHAHYYNPNRCAGDGKHDFRSLAKLTFVPKNDIETPPASENSPLLPKSSIQSTSTYNSNEINNLLKEQLEKDPSNKLHMVHHGDHMAYLVHDSTNDVLYLQSDKGGYHGKLNIVEKRSWEDENANKKNYLNKIKLLFFDCAACNISSNILDTASSFIKLESDRVTAACCPFECKKYGKRTCIQNEMETDAGVSKICRSQIFVQNICCSSEIPDIEAILKPLPGVSDVQVNPSNKAVYIMHDYTLTSAADAVEALNNEKFGAKLKEDGSSTISKRGREGFSTIYAQRICCSGETPEIESILKPMQGISSVKVNPKTKMIYITHDHNITSASDAVDALNKAAFQAEVRKDAGAVSKEETKIQSEIYAKKICCSGEIPEIESILKPLPGVTEVKVNPKTKTIYITHDYTKTSANDAVDALNKADFQAELRKDAGAISSVSRSEFFVNKICCSSEIPEIESILKPLPGISEVKVIPKTKTVYIIHDYTLTSASDIIEALNKEAFGAEIRKDSGATSKTATENKEKFEAEIRKDGSTISTKPTINLSTGTSKKVSQSRSELYVEKICCASEIPAIESILKPLPGISEVKVNPTTKAVYIIHDHTKTSASDAVEALNKEKFGAKIRKDGGTISVPSVSRSELYVEKICCASEIPAIESILKTLPGISEIKVNPTTKAVYIIHDYTVTSASDATDALNKEKFGAKIRNDGGAISKASEGRSELFVESTLLLTGVFDSNLLTQLLKKSFAKYSKKQVKNYEIVFASKTLQIDHNPNLLKIKQLLFDLQDSVSNDINVTVLRDGELEGLWIISKDEDSEDAPEVHSASLKPAVFMSGVFWIISLFSLISENWIYLRYVGLISVALGLPTIGEKAWHTVQRCQFDANCLMFIAAVGAIAMQEYSEAAAVTFLYSVSEFLETCATSRARNAFSNIAKMRPERANLIDQVNGNTIIVSASSVKIGSIVSVRTGDKIPCDGKVVEGSSQVDESSLTGESRPVKKSIGDDVSGGTINVGLTQLLVKTTQTSEDSAVSRLIELVEDAQANQSKTQQMINDLAKIYTPVVISLAFLMMTIPWAFGKEIGYLWTMNGLITLVVACPCALIISTPVTYVAGLTAAAQNGVLIKGGAFLEALAAVGKICFDKTGTLTMGEFALLHLDVIGDQFSRKQVFEYLYLMESPSSHPLASALVTAARNEGVSNKPKHLDIKDHTIYPGEGVAANINGTSVYVGNHRMIARLGVNGLTDSVLSLTKSWAAAGGTIGFLCIGSDIAAAYCVADSVRPEAATVLKSIQALGIETYMLTGDNNDAAKVIGSQVGLSFDKNQIKSELLPEDKYEIVQEMKALEASSNNRLPLVLMCGDGVNDAPALASADVGVAMGAGSQLAMITADITLLDSHLTKLEYAIIIGRRVKRTILENIIFSLIAKGVVLLLTITGRATLGMAIAADLGSMLIVTLNGMKLLSKKESNVLMKS